MRWIVFIGILAWTLQSCQAPEKREWNQWKEERRVALTDPYGWPSVVGLFWIKNSMAYFGSKENNDFILPQTAATSMGRIVEIDSAYYLDAYSSLKVKVNGLNATKVRMLTDKEEGGPTIASWRSLQWHIIERQDKAYLRVKDSLSSYRQALLATDIPYYPYDETYRVKAKFTPVDSSQTIQYDNILGMKFDTPFAGYLDFQLHGESHRLAALYNDEETYMVIFSDATTGIDTYGGGRYLYPKVADSQGETILDFNQSINPPCVFTPHATCPLPPSENLMDCGIVVGEKLLKLYE